MKKYFLLTIIIFALFSISFGQTSDKKQPEKLQILTDIGKEFDQKYLQNDIKENKSSNTLPISAFNFPRTKYIGSAGVGDFEFKDLKITGVYFLVGNHDDFRKLFLKDSKDDYQVFFTILTYSLNSDSLDQKVSSRNFPNYIAGQGYMKTEYCKIDYFTFIDSSGKSFAIVNEKIFDLTENGKTLILLPSPNGSLNFIQVKTPYLTNTTFAAYYHNLLKNSEIKSLISQTETKNK